MLKYKSLTNSCISKEMGGSPSLSFVKTLLECDCSTLRFIVHFKSMGVGPLTYQIIFFI